MGGSFEYRSARQLCGLPLLHVVGGTDPATGRPREAHGFFAVGSRARGVFAFGGVARGWFAFGGVAMGLVACGGVGIGLVSIGGLALGLLLAYGGLGIGCFALGGLAAGYHAVGGMVMGWHGIGGMVFAHQGYGGLVRAAEVMEEMASMPRASLALYATESWTDFLMLVWLPVSAFVWCASSWGQGQAAMTGGGDPDPRVSKRIFWTVPAVTLIGVVCVVLLRILTDPTAPLAGAGAPSRTWVVIPSVVTFIGMFLFVLALPLWLRMVPVNRFYGLRIPSVMVSDERWYAANAYAGQVFLVWSLVTLTAGLAGFFQLPRYQDGYPWALLALTLFSAGAALVSVFSWLRRHPLNGPETQPSHLAKIVRQVVVGVVVAFFIRGFILETFRIPNSEEPGVAKGSHWVAWKLDTGFVAGQLVVFQHENGNPWIARIEKVGQEGLVLRRADRADAFSVTWDQVIGKLLFSHFTPDTVVRP